MIASGAVSVRLLHPHRRVTPRHAQDHDFAGALTADQGAAEHDTDTAIRAVAQSIPARFTGSVRLDAERLVRAFGAVNNEVLAHLLNSGAKVEVTLEVVAELPSGFDDTTLRVVGENARTLNFDDPSFG